MDTLSNTRHQPGEAVRDRSVHCARQVGDASDILAPLSPSVADMKGEAMLQSNAMTIGQLSRRTGVPIKALRTYEDFGFLYTRVLLLSVEEAASVGRLVAQNCSMDAT